MRKQLLVASMVSLVILAAYLIPNEGQLNAFEDWKRKYGVSWAPEEEAYRRLVFEKNIIYIEHHNADSTQTYKKGVNQFSIYTSEEFASRFLASVPMMLAHKGDDIMGSNVEIDWSLKITPVKNQGQCGSCWAFSAAGAVEAFYLLKKGQNLSLSEQQLVDCSRSLGNQGCNGGYATSALTYIKNNGITTTAAYPYVAKDQICKTQGGQYRIGGYVSSSGCLGLTNGISSNPIAVTVDASNWSAYKSGVFTNCQKSVNHAVLLVGVAGGNWKIKNSWGNAWGEQGFMRLGPGNTCGLCSYAGVYPH